MSRLVVLDSGAVTAMTRSEPRRAAAIRALRREDRWPPIVPSAVIVESVTGRPGRDASTNRVLKACQVTALDEIDARRAARLRFLARRGSAVDAIVVAAAEPGGHVLTGDVGDLEALAAHAVGVTVQRI